MIQSWNDGVIRRKRPFRSLEDPSVPSTAVEETEDVIHGCIVDDHCDIVPFLHAVYRHRKVSDAQTVFMLHIDAHPDLSVPSATDYSSGFDDWADKDTLYNLLRDDGGISEFLLPLMQQKHISQVLWLRADASQQLPDGRHCFHLQQRKSTKLKPKVTVTWPTSYYIDEDIYSEINPKEMAASSVIDVVTLTAKDDLFVDFASKRFDIIRTTSSQQTTRSTSQAITTSNNEHKVSWILDICLDYFFVQNPFFLLLKDLLKNESLPFSIEYSLEVIVDVIRNLPYRQKDIIEENKEIYKLKSHCWEVFCAVLSRPEDEKEVLRLTALFANLTNPPPPGLADFIKVVTSLSKHAREFIAEKKTLLLLPHEDSIEENELIDRIDRIRDFLRSFIITMDTSLQTPCPLCITIARSMSDGYTPEHIAKNIEENVLKMLRTLFGELGCKKGLKIHDIADDAEEMCCTLFLSKEMIEHYVTSSS